jgi:hypothetical protein
MHELEASLHYQFAVAIYTLLKLFGSECFRKKVVGAYFISVYIEFPKSKY